MADMPKFHNMSLDYLVKWCLDNNNDMYDTGEWPDTCDLSDDEEVSVREEYEAIAFDIWQSMQK